MAFWGVEVKPGKPFRQIPTEGTGSQLHLSNAVLGLNPKQGERTVVKCTVGSKSNPEIFLASLTGGAVESCSLDLIISEDTEFSVTGSTSVHLTGYYMPIEPQEDTDDEYDEYEEGDEFDDEDDDSEDMVEYDSEEDDEEEEDEDAEDDQIVQHGNKGVTIEEITDEAATLTLPVIRANPIVSESFEESEEDEEDEDGFERHHKRKTHKIEIEAGQPAAKKQAVEGQAKNEASQAGDGTVKSTSKASKKEEAAAKTPALDKTKAGGASEEGKPEKTPKDSKTGGEATPARSEKKRKAEKTPGGKSADGGGKAATEKKARGEKSPNGAPVAEKKAVTSEQKKPAEAPAVDEKRVDAGGKKKQGNGTPEEAKTPKAGKGGKGTVREFPNGLKIEELGMGRPDGKKAERGKRIQMHYVGKLAKNGKVFDASRGKPFSFRLGTGEVIAGWDKGIEGMRVGDKRRLTIPPSMGYGARGAPPDIPGNATLMFDVELVNVK